MNRRTGFLLNLWMCNLILFTIAIGTVVLQAQYHIPPTPWVVAAACVFGLVNVLLFVAIVWTDYNADKEHHLW